MRKSGLNKVEKTQLYRYVTERREENASYQKIADEVYEKFGWKFTRQYIQQISVSFEEKVAIWDWELQTACNLHVLGYSTVYIASICSKNRTHIKKLIEDNTEYINGIREAYVKLLINNGMRDIDTLLVYEGNVAKEKVKNELVKAALAEVYSSGVDDLLVELCKKRMSLADDSNELSVKVDKELMDKLFKRDELILKLKAK